MSTATGNGRGFGFDIFPVDPDYRDENGEKMWVADDEESDDWSDDDPASSDGGNEGSEGGATGEVGGR